MRVPCLLMILIAAGACLDGGGDVDRPDSGAACEASKLTTVYASDRETEDQFGDSSAIDGDVAVVGAPTEGSMGMVGRFQGAAYVLERSSGAWSEVATIRPADRSPNAGFGRSVDVSNDYAIVGSPGQEDATGLGAGAAYVLRRTASGWAEAVTLRASDGQPDDLFGFAVGLNGSLAIVGAPGEDGGAGDPTRESGAVYVFERDAAASWNETAILRASDAAVGDVFGNSVAISGSYALVGSRLLPRAGDPVEPPGVVFVFERTGDGSGWSELAKLTASNADSGDQFGYALALSGERAIIGAQLEDGGEGDPTRESGAAYVFERDTAGTWSEVAILRASDTAAGDGFGWAVGIEGDLAVATSPAKVNLVTANAGYAYFYERSASGMWGEIAIVSAPNPEVNSGFGVSVEISGDTTILGAPGYNSVEAPLQHAGAVFLLDCR